MVNAALVLEGGGLRGMYTAGILDRFIERELLFSDVFGVSAGITTGLSYISKQIGRTANINLKYVRDKRYLGIGNFIKDRTIFGFDFIYNEIANELEPFDYETFEKSEQRCVVVATNCKTGKAIYFEKSNCSDIFLASRASASMPFVAPIVHVNNIPCLDGGVGDAIPVKKAIEEGHKKIVVVLTRDKDYRKKEGNSNSRLSSIVYKNYPELVKSLMDKNKRYNETVEYIQDLEKQGRIFVIRPLEPPAVSRTERNLDKLRKLYLKAYRQAITCEDKLMDYLNS